MKVIKAKTGVDQKAKMASIAGHSFNMGPYGKMSKCYFSQKLEI